MKSLTFQGLGDGSVSKVQTWEPEWSFNAHIKRTYAFSQLKSDGRRIPGVCWPASDNQWNAPIRQEGQVWWHRLNPSTQEQRQANLRKSEVSLWSTQWVSQGYTVRPWLGKKKGITIPNGQDSLCFFLQVCSSILPAYSSIFLVTIYQIKKR